MFKWKWVVYMKIQIIEFSANSIYECWSWISNGNALTRRLKDYIIYVGYTNKFMYKIFFME